MNIPLAPTAVKALSLLLVLVADGFFGCNSFVAEIEYLHVMAELPN